MTECWTVSWTVIPAILHYLENIVGAGFGFLQALTLLDHFDDINTLHIAVRRMPKGEHLPQRHSKGPNIASMWECAVVVAFRCVPFDGPLAALTRLIVVILGAESTRQSKIGYFRLVSWCQQDIPGGQVSMNKVLRLQIVHSCWIGRNRLVKSPSRKVQFRSMNYRMQFVMPRFSARNWDLFDRCDPTGSSIEIPMARALAQSSMADPTELK